MGSEEKRWAGRTAAEEIRTCEGVEMEGRREKERERGCVVGGSRGRCEVRRVEWGNGKKGLLKEGGGEGM